MFNLRHTSLLTVHTYSSSHSHKTSGRLCRNRPLESLSIVNDAALET